MMMYQVVLYNCANGNKVQKSVKQTLRPSDDFIEKSRAFYGAERAEVIELPLKKVGAFWNNHDIKQSLLDPHDIYIYNRGGKGKIMASGVMPSMDGQVAHWALSGWMDYRKAHVTVNAYFEQFWADHSPVSEV